MNVRHLDLFSGIGGFALACSWTWGDRYENVGHSEVEKYACKVYHKHFSGSPCLGDITKIEWKEGQADIITGGFPCQPHSVAGKRKGEDDHRDLWGECVRAVRTVRPRIALFENVPGIFVSNGGRFFNRVMSDLAEIGYDAEWQVLSAAAVGAPHLRKRVWIVAFSERMEWTKGAGWERLQSVEQETVGSVAGDVRAILQNPIGIGRIYGEFEEGRDKVRKQRESGAGGGVGVFAETPKLADPYHARPQGWDKWQWENGYTWSGSWPGEAEWFAQSGMGRVAHGLPARVDRLRGLGNAIVPQVAYEILRPIRELF